MSIFPFPQRLIPDYQKHPTDRRFECFESTDDVTKVADSIEFYVRIYLSSNEAHDVLLILEKVFHVKFIDKYSRNQRLEFNYKLGGYCQKLHFHH